MQLPGGYTEVVIDNIRQEAPDVKTYILAPTGDDTLPYNAGQFLTFAFQHHNKEERRSFSISSSPALNEPLAITVKRVANGAYSRLLIDRVAEGDKLYTTGPAGLFTLPGDAGNYKQVIFFAAGIGITPVYSLIKTLLKQHPAMQVVLVYSNSSIEETVFYNELLQLQLLYTTRFKIEFLFSNSFNLGRARLSKWLLPTLLAEYAIPEKDKILFYTCGPFSYMRMVVFGLEEQGIYSSRIRRENFNTNERITIKQTPPDIATHHAIINMNGMQHSIPVAYPDTILHAAKKAGLALPYSCETGRCGSCVATCTEGRVWLSYNEVLMDADIAAGRILTCTGHPVYGDVVINV